MAIFNGLTNIENVLNGNDQIAKVCNGENVVWENWANKTGNPYTFDNIASAWRVSGFDMGMSEYQIKTILACQNYYSYSGDFQNCYFAYTFTNEVAQKIRPTRMVYVSHSGYTHHTEIDNVTITDSLGHTKAITLGDTIVYDDTLIDCVKITLNYHRQNGSFVDPTCTPYLQTTNYQQKGQLQ